MEKEHNIDLIEQFLNGELDEYEKSLVEKTIKDDPDFARELDAQRLLMDGIRFAGRKKLLEQLKTWDEELLRDGGMSQKTTRARTLRWYYLAASFSIILVAAGILLTNMDQDYSQLSSSHFIPYDQLPSGTRSSGDGQDPWKIIYSTFDRGEYDEAIEKIQALKPEQKTELTNFILANSYQAKEDFEKAKDIYTEIINLNGVYAFPSRWYLALCYLSTDEYDTAKSLLDELAASGSSYSQNAKKLLNDLK